MPKQQQQPLPSFTQRLVNKATHFAASNSARGRGEKFKTESATAAAATVGAGEPIPSTKKKRLPNDAELNKSKQESHAQLCKDTPENIARTQSWALYRQTEQKVAAEKGPLGRGQRARPSAAIDKPKKELKLD